ncbi:hypothetical protein B5E67_15180 [Faecalibacterium sp. An122]|nr:hypothetical protein B5E67_15180 [Faecalibacterium sp. An122]
MKIHRFFVLLRKGWAAAPGENSSAFFLPKRLVSKMSLSQLYKIKQKWENLKSGLDTGGGMVL